MFKAYEKRKLMSETFTKWVGESMVAVMIIVCIGTPASLLATALFCVTYPVLTLIVKLVNMFTRNKEIKALAIHCAGFEGICESSFQFALQLFIAFTMAHRQPSNTQLISMTASGIMVSKTLIDTEISMRYTQKGVPLKLAEEIGNSILLLPVFLSGTIGIIGSIAVSSSLLRYNYITFLTFILLLLGLDLLVHKMMKNDISLRSTIISAFVS